MRRIFFLSLVVIAFISTGVTNVSAKALVKGDDLTRLFDMDLLLFTMDGCRSAGRMGSPAVRSWRGRSHRLVEEYEDIVSQSQDSESGEVAEAHFFLGMILGFEKNEPRHALEHLDRFLSLRASSRDDRVEQAVQAMCLIEPFGRNARMEEVILPRLLSDAMKIENSSKRLEKISLIASFHPYSPLPLYVMGQLYEGEGKKGLAIEAFEKSIELRPTCAPCHEALGRILIEKKQEEEGKMHLSKADLFNPPLDKFLSNQKINK